MMIKHVFVAGLFLLVTLSAFSQRVDGRVTLTSNAKVVDNTLGQLSFELYKGTVVYLEGQHGENFAVNLTGYVKDPKKLPALIYGDAKYQHPIGKLNSVKRLVKFGSLSYFFHGSMSAEQINLKDLPEYTLSALLDSAVRSEKEIKTSLSKYAFREERFFGYDSYFCSQNTLEDPSPGDRIRILFKNGKLKGVIHQFCVGNLKLENKLAYTYLWVDSSVGAAEKKQMMNDYTKFRHSVD